MRKIDYIRARKLLRNKDNWSDSINAVDKKGKRCMGGDPQATKWCALHACNLFAKENDHCRKELALAARQLGFLSITNLNDSGTHADVIKMFDMAIEMCDVIKVVVEVSRWHSYTPLSERD